jgi:hypothetical protein
MVLAHSAGERFETDEEAVSGVASSWRYTLEDLMPAAASPSELQLIEALHSHAANADATDPFANLFDAVSARCAGAYGESWPGDVRFALGIAFPPSGRPLVPYGLVAETRLSPPPTVTLGILPQGFGPAAYAAMPAVLVHECVCHVPARQGGEVSNSSVFAEGFMDWAARFFFERWMPEIDAGMAPAALEHALRLDAVVTRPDTREGAARLRGRRAAERVAGWLQADVGRPRAEAQAAVAKLAVELNTTEASLAVKDDLAVRLVGLGDDDTRERLERYFKGEASAADML